MQVRQRLTGAFRSVRETFKSLETNPKLKTFTRSISLRASSKKLHKGDYMTSHHRLVPDGEPASPAAAAASFKPETAEDAVTPFGDSNLYSDQQVFDIKDASDINKPREATSPFTAKLNKRKRATVRKASEAFRRLSVSLRSKRKRQKRRKSAEGVNFEENRLEDIEGPTTIWKLRAEGSGGSTVESEDIIGTIEALEEKAQVGTSLKVLQSKKGLRQKTKSVRKALKKNMVAWADAMSYPATGSTRDSTVYTTCSLCNRAREMAEYRPNLGSCYRCHNRMYQDAEATLYQTCQLGW